MSRKEKVRLRVYSIDECGFYPRGDNKMPRFGPIAEVLDDLSGWLEGKIIRNTIVSGVNDGSTAQTYCYGVKQIDSDYLVTMWNSVPHATGEGVASIDGRGKVGEAKTASAKAPPDHIPGFATYFWVLPDELKLISISFVDALKYRSIGFKVKQLRDYLRTFAVTQSRYVQKVSRDVSEPGTFLDENRYTKYSTEIENYQDPEGAGGATEKLTFKLTTTFFSTGRTNVTLARKYREHIRAVERKINTDLISKEDRGNVRSLAKMFGLGFQSTTRISEEFRYQFKIENLGEEELEEIIQIWEDSIPSEDDGQKDKWSDVGFKFKKTTATEDFSGSTQWLKRNHLSLTHYVEIGSGNPGIADSTLMLRSLLKIRRRVLERISRSREK